MEDAMAGLRDFARRTEPALDFPKGTALLVVDMQRFFLEPDSHAYLPDGVAAMSKVNELVTAYASKKLPLAFSRHVHREGGDPGALGRWWNDLIMEGDEMAELHPDLVAPDTAHYVQKDTYDMFRGNDLDDYLRANRVRTVVVTGVMTHLCVETTARSAFVRGYDVIVPADACGTSDPDLHVAALRTLADGFAVVCPTAVLLERIWRA